ncbi:MAG: M48 family metallopeptidase [Deltaproteobacteria bacterium]|nr:M48 family metallopeptidase [Deltaproteobacteria bacterium]MBN2670061.1 M48 family metallopeptidase [Deltaproteobacteria bacterium]
MQTAQFGGMIYGAGHNGESCQIAVTSSGLEFFIEDRPVGKILYGVIQVSLTGTEDRYVKFESSQPHDEWYVLSGNKAVIDAIRQTGAPMQVLSMLDSLAAKKKRRAAGRYSFLVGLAAAVALLVGGMFMALRPAAAAVTEHISTEWETELGRSEAAKILEANQTCTDEELNSAVQEIGRRLAMGMGDTPYQWHIKVIDDPEVNAFALPGGYVFINRGLIEASDNAEEVAGVLAHEFQHVLKRHGMKNVVANLGLRLVLYAIVGNSDAVQGFLMENMASLAAMQFSRSQETEADLSAVDLAYRSQIDPRGFLAFMKKLEEKEDSVGAVLTIVSTHPGSAERMDDISAMIEKKGAPRIEPFTSDWTAIKKKCSPASVTTTDSL